MYTRHQFNVTKKCKELTGSKRRIFYILVYPGTQELINTSSYWSGGTKDVYHLFDLGTHKLSFIHGGAYPNFESVTRLTPGLVVVQTGTNSGKPAYPHFRCLEGDFDALKKILGV